MESPTVDQLSKAYQEMIEYMGLIGSDAQVPDILVNEMAARDLLINRIHTAARLAIKSDTPSEETKKVIKYVLSLNLT